MVLCGFMFALSHIKAGFVRKVYVERVHAMLMVKAEEDCPYCEQVFKRQKDLKQYVGIDILGLFCDHCGIRVKGGK